MARPVFLVIEVEQPDGLSTRKLVLETAKYNVLTAHSGKEGIEIAETHPVQALVLHHEINSHDPQGLLSLLQGLVGEPESSAF